MPNYINKYLACLNHYPPIKPQQPPHPYNTPVYGQKCQFFIPTTTNKKLTPAQLNHCQEVCGFSNNYAQSIDNTMQTAVSAISSSLSTRSWKDIEFWINKFLDYVATHPGAKILYHASKMHLWIHSDASYINEPKAWSRNGGYFYLLEKPKLPINPNDPPPKLNAPVLVHIKNIDPVMYYVQVSKTGSDFINSKDDATLWNELHEMVHIQGPTPIQFEKQCCHRYHHLHSCTT